MKAATFPGTSVYSPQLHSEKKNNTGSTLT